MRCSVAHLVTAGSHRLGRPQAWEEDSGSEVHRPKRQLGDAVVVRRAPSGDVVDEGGGCLTDWCR